MHSERRLRAFRDGRRGGIKKFFFLPSVQGKQCHTHREPGLEIGIKRLLGYFNILANTFSVIVTCVSLILSFSHNTVALFENDKSVTISNHVTLILDE